MEKHYKIKCLKCGREIEDDGKVLDCPQCSEPGLIRTHYDAKVLKPGPWEEGIYRFYDWMPVHRRLNASGSPITFQSENINRRLGTTRLWITFNGYWPERGARMMSGTFKECEAFTVAARLPQDQKDTLVVASAGNTARAFARVCSQNNIPLILVVPEAALPNLWTIDPMHDCVKVLVAGGDADYFDAIHLSNMVVSLPGFQAEGGAKNVARRDGMSTTVYSAVTTIGEIPEYYFQAVGSGTGAIAAWEANLRFLQSGLYGDRKMKLMVSQNLPFIPMVESWNKRSRDFLCPSESESKYQIDIINAKVLSNRKPPWGLKGGLFDALTDTEGEVLAADNEAAIKAGELFRDAEGIDICPAASIAFASLIHELETGRVKKDALIMLNITGGGSQRVLKEHQVHAFPVHGKVMPSDFNTATVKQEIDKIYSGG